jgi:hypothetical protein
MIDSEVAKDFLERDVNVLSNPAFLKQFEPNEIAFKEIREYLKEMIEGADESIPNSIRGKLNEYLARWNSFHQQMKNYNATEDAQRQFSQSRVINQNIMYWYNGITNGYTNEQNQQRLIPEPFLSYYSILKNWRLNVKEINNQMEAQLNMAQAHAKDTEQEHDKYVKYEMNLKKQSVNKLKKLVLQNLGIFFSKNQRHLVVFLLPG